MESRLLCAVLIIASVTADVVNIGTQASIPRGDSPLGTPRALEVNRTGLMSLFKGGNASSNLLLGLYSEDACKWELGIPRFEEADFEHGGPSALKVVKAAREDAQHVLESCEVVQEDRCASVYYVPRGGNCRSIKTAASTQAQDIQKLVQQNSVLSVYYKNKCDHAVDMFWVNPNGDETKLLRILPEDGASQTTYLGHIFCVRHALTNEVVDWFQVDVGGTRSLECTESEDVCLEEAASCESDEEKGSLDDAMQSFLWEKEWQNRLALNRIQPRLVRNLTDVGFEKRRISDELLETLQMFFEQRQKSAETEVSAGPVMNQNTVNTYMTHLGTRERGAVETAVRPVLESWSRLELKMTSLYGIRKYVNGAVLNMHVDTGNTHVVSAIINVDQKVNEDWKLEIMDLDGIVHKVAMAPGDMVLYESAKVLHGRPEPLNGDFYANVFIHYAPIQGWNFQLRL